MSSHPPYFGACRIYTICIVREEKRLFHADNAVPWSDRPEAPAEHPLTMEYMTFYTYLPIYGEVH